MTNAEVRVINSICKSKNAVALHSGIDDLFNAYSDVWDGMKSYYTKYHSVPSVDVLVQKYPDLDEVDVSGDTRYYIDQLRDQVIKARIVNLVTTAGAELKTDSPSRVLEKLNVGLTKLSRLSSSARDLDITDFEAAAERIQQVAERSSEMGGAPGIKTGLKSIDLNYPTGMAAGHLIVPIGYSGKGKTWFASYLACQAWAQGFHPMIVSLEMSPEAMSDRIYTMMASGLFSASGFSRGDVNIDSFREWGRKTMTDKPPFTIVSTDGATDMTPSMVEGKIEQHRPHLCIADYHQLFTNNGRSNSPIERAMNVSREFKRIALSRKIAMMDITAVTADDSTRDNPPMLSQVAWSKALEYDADLAFAVHREGDSNMINIVGRKNRFGDLFDFFMKVDLDRGLWSEEF